MVQIEGTYSTVQGQEYVDFLLHMGVPKEEAEKLFGTHWTMKVWKDGKSWAGHLTCREIPEWNNLDIFTEGVEKNVDHPVYGGKAKVVFKENASGDGFLTCSDSEQYGKITWDEKYTNEGVNFTISCKEKSIEVFWHRAVKVEGSYKFEKGENMDAFFKAAGYGDDSLLDSMKNYRLQVWFKGNRFCTKETFGDLNSVVNDMTLGVEGPYRYPDSIEGEAPLRTAIVSQSGPGKFVSVTKNPTGLDEEWTMTFNDYGVVLTGVLKNSGETTTTYMKRYTEITGTYKFISAVGLEDFAKKMGIPLKDAAEMFTDASTRMSLTDLGNGFQRHQMAGKKLYVDITMKMNEEFSYYHPILKEEVKAVVTQNENIISAAEKTSLGTMMSQVHINDTFLIASLCHFDANANLKIIFERC